MYEQTTMLVCLISSDTTSSHVLMEKLVKLQQKAVFIDGEYKSSCHRSSVFHTSRSLGYQMSHFAEHVEGKWWD